MAEYTLEYTLTERTRRQIIIEADSAVEAIAAVENYEVDTTDSWEVDSLEWSIQDVEVRSVADVQPTHPEDEQPWY